MNTLEKILQEIDDEVTKAEDAGFIMICPEWVENIIKKHLSDSEIGWIPCSERMPKRTLEERINNSYKKYLVFIESLDGWDIDTALYDFWNDKKWREAHDGYGEIENVIAWRPLPEPYKPPVESAE